MNRPTLHELQLATKLTYASTKVTEHLNRIFSGYNTETKGIYAYKKHQMHKINNGQGERVFNAIFTRTNESYHRNDAVVGYNGFPQEYTLTKYGHEIYDLVDLSDKNIYELALSLNLPKMTRDEATQHMILNNKNIQEFSQIIDINRFNIIGVYGNNIVIENEYKVNTFNREYTTFTALPKQAKKLLENKELFDASKFGLNTLLQTYEYNFNMDGTKYKNNNSIQDLPELFKYTHDPVQIYKLSQFNGWKKYNIPISNIKTACTAVSYGASIKSAKEMLIKGLSDKIKNTIKKYFEESNFNKLFKEIILVANRLKGEIRGTKWISIIGATGTRVRSHLARFCSYFESQFRLAARVVLKMNGIKFLQCHDAIFTENEEGRELVYLIRSSYKHITDFELI